jgi:hypothetical protein
MYVKAPAAVEIDVAPLRPAVGYERKTVVLATAGMGAKDREALRVPAREFGDETPRGQLEQLP